MVNSRTAIVGLGLSKGVPGWVVGQVLTDGGLPCLKALTADDCVTLLQSPHAEVRLGAQLHISRLAGAQAVRQEERAEDHAIVPGSPGTRGARPDRNAGTRRA